MKRPALLPEARDAMSGFRQKIDALVLPWARHRRRPAGLSLAIDDDAAIQFSARGFADRAHLADRGDDFVAVD